MHRLLSVLYTATLLFFIIQSIRLYFVHTNLMPSQLGGFGRATVINMHSSRKSSVAPLPVRRYQYSYRVNNIEDD
ncbi:hypothetical protein F4777DRAFT_565791 [Nemania sp. FL0916]|nr:hypothetical protein F4777DRAFT_565791 [Nemania sp. FL0916]